MEKSKKIPRKYILLSAVSPIISGIVLYFLDAYSALIIVILSPLMFLLPALLLWKLWRIGTIASRSLSALNLLWIVFLCLPYEYKMMFKF